MIYFDTVFMLTLTFNLPQEHFVILYAQDSTFFSLLSLFKKYIIFKKEKKKIIPSLIINICTVDI